ncbi:MAG: restriction endonuclease subunit S [Nanoarchaeota archaeon]
MHQIAKTEEYRETELGELPVDWEISEFNDCISLETGKRMKGGALEKGEIPSIGGQHIDNFGRIKWNKDMKYISKEFYDNELKKGKLNKGDVLVVKDGATTGKTAYLNEIPSQGAAINEHVFIIRSKDKNQLTNEFVFYYLFSVEGYKSLRQNFRGLIGGVGRNDILSIKIPLPPLPEQQKIAYVLSAIQDDKEKTENIINSYKELKKSLMKHLFKYGPVKFQDAEKVKLKETEIGEMPDNWEVKEIRDLIEKTKQKDMRKEDAEFKYIDVSSIDRDFYRITGFTLHKGKTSPSRARKIVKDNDVIVATVRPTLRRIAIVSGDYDNQICSTAFCVLRANKEQLDSKFLYYSTQRTLFFDSLSSIQRGASYPAVTDSDIKKQKMAYPNPAYQEEISEILSSVDFKIEQEENKKQALEELFKSMLHNLMAAKIRVKDIDINNNLNMAKMPQLEGLKNGKD